MPELFPRKASGIQVIGYRNPPFFAARIRRILFNKDVSPFSRITIYTDVFHFCSYDWTIRGFSSEGEGGRGVTPED